MNVRISGAICGHMWMPQSMGAILGNWSITDRRRRTTSHLGFCMSDIIDSIIMDNGGDFQDAKLTGDSVIIFEYRKPTSDGYIYHCREFEVADCPCLSAYVNNEAYISDYYGD